MVYACVCTIWVCVHSVCEYKHMHVAICDNQKDNCGCWLLGVVAHIFNPAPWDRLAWSIQGVPDNHVWKLRSLSFIYFFLSKIVETKKQIEWS